MILGVLYSYEYGNYYLNEIDNIYYKCHDNCKTCNGVYNNIINDMHCNFCIINAFFLDSDNKSNCYYKEEILRSEKYYLSNIDNNFHKSYYLIPCCLNCYTLNQTPFCKRISFLKLEFLKIRFNIQKKLANSLVDNGI